MKTSKLQLRVFAELAYFFREVQHRRLVAGHECDVFLPEIQIGIEVDGLHWHRAKRAKDLRKVQELEKAGVFLIRVREEGLEQLTEHDVFFSARTSDAMTMSRLVKAILDSGRVPVNFRAALTRYVRDEKLVAELEFKEILHRRPLPLFSESLNARFPEAAALWHPTKNGGLSPSDVAPHTRLAVWWKCPAWTRMECPSLPSHQGQGLSVLLRRSCFRREQSGCAQTRLSLRVVSFQE